MTQEQRAREQRIRREYGRRAVRVIRIAAMRDRQLEKSRPREEETAKCAPEGIYGGGGDWCRCRACAGE